MFCVLLLRYFTPFGLRIVSLKKPWYPFKEKKGEKQKKETQRRDTKKEYYVFCKMQSVQSKKKIRKEKRGIISLQKT